jgi:hypothetical protein
MLQPLTRDELDERFTDVPLAKKPSKQAKSQLTRAKSRLARLARIVSSAWGWLCC